MRKFYIFKINDTFNILNKEDGFSIYKQMETIKRIDKNYYYNALKIYETLANTFDKYELDKVVYENHKDSYFYTKYQNIHMINNYYRNEESRLTINKAYLLLETNACKSEFFKDLENQSLFVCDFDNKDYFWLDSLYSIVN